MNKRRSTRKEKSAIVKVISKHVLNNRKQYMITALLFFIGLVVGIMFINHASDAQYSEITNYIKSVVGTMQESGKIDYGASLKNSITSNIVLTLVMWVAASTIIGIPIVYGMPVFRGFVLGYTISGILATLGAGYGILFSVACLLLHNIIFIPVLLAISVSGMNLYHSIVKDRRRNNIKLEFMRHTVFCIIMFLLLMIAALIETYISINLGKITLNYINI